MDPSQVFPKAKAATQRAIQIDDSYAEAHAVLGYIIFWHDWDWQAAENEIKRALAIDPNSADAHIAYAHILSNTGRHAEALAQGRQARELDPLNLRINSLEGQFLLQAGKPDEALQRLARTFELEPNYFIARLFASRAYFAKGMFPEALAEARKAREISPSSAHPLPLIIHALTKLGQKAEAREVLNELLRFNSERYVPPAFIALAYTGLGEKDQAMIWLERGYQVRDPRMTFLNVDSQWSEMRDDPRFQELLQRMRF
jgi:tetratricopeptide (TPR) repeat protein